MKPCKNHPDRKMIAFELCRSCYDALPDRKLKRRGQLPTKKYLPKVKNERSPRQKRTKAEYMRDWRTRNPEKQIHHMKKYYHKNKFYLKMMAQIRYLEKKIDAISSES